jgi:hypothetical protein
MVHFKTNACRLCMCRPQIEHKLSEVVAAASSLRARKQACERMLVAAQHS